jgi:mycothiol system anti-sigma-R factor
VHTEGPHEGHAGEHDDCDELIANLFLMIDGELEAGSCGDLEEHLRRCGACLQRFGVERAFKELIRRRCGQEPVPNLLIERIRVTLRSQIQ